MYIHTRLLPCSLDLAFTELGDFDRFKRLWIEQEWHEIVSVEANIRRREKAEENDN